MKKNGWLILASVLGLAVGYGIGWVSMANKDVEAVQNVVAMKWGDGKYGKAFYGAEVYLAPNGQQYSVRGRIWIGRGNNYCHEIGQLGVVSKAEDAVAQWGHIDWDAAGVTIGPGNPTPVVVPRTTIESNR